MRNGRSHLLAASVIVSVGLVLAGCSGNTDSAPSGDGEAGAGSTGNATAGGEATIPGGTVGNEPPETLTLAIGGESEDGYDPTLGWGRYGSPLFQSTLLKLDADLNIVNDLATGYEVSEDGLTWTVTIRDDAVFSDGEPVTAEDVAYTFTTASQQPGLTDVSSLAEATALDETTVELVLDEPRSTFVYRLTSLGIVPEHAHGAGYAQDPIGSGPFTLVQWDRGQQMIVQRNEQYYGDLPEFERVVFLFTDEDGSLAAARTGSVQLAGVGSALATSEISGFTLTPVESIDNRGIAFPYVPDEGETDDDGNPIGNDVTSDRAIRQAINLAVDREQLVEGILNGFGSPATGPVDGAPWYEPASAIEDADPEAAIAILEEAGWTDSDGDGVRERDGVSAEFRLIYPSSDSVRQGLALAVGSQVAEVGIQMNVEGVTWEEIETHLHSDAIMLGWGSHDPTEMYNLHSSRYAGVEFWNTGFYSNDVVDANLEAALLAADEDEALAYWRAAQLDEDGNGFTASADAAWAWLVNLDHTYYVHECLDLGAIQTEPHGHGWPITAGILGWTWTC